MDQLGPDPEDPDPDLNPPPEPTPSATEPAFDQAALDATQPAGLAAAVDTDTAVQTEIVETPPVKMFVPEPPSGRRRVGGRLSALIAVLGIVAIGGAAALGYTLNQDLSATKATLSSTEGELGSAKTTLESTTGELTTTTTTLTTAKAERMDLDSEITDLAAQVSSQTKCVGLQTAALAELSRISQLQTDNNNRTALGSTWNKADDKRSKAVSDALDAYYQAYSKAFDGNLSSARAWAAKGKEAQAIIAVQTKQQLAEFGLIDKSAAEIEAAINALEKQLVAMETTCEAVS